MVSRTRNAALPLLGLDWGTVSMPFATWNIALIAYGVFAVLLWAGFRITRRPAH